MAPKILVVTGPTASGKTALGIALAKKIGGEIVSADSMQIYRGMDIGTAKPRRRRWSAFPTHIDLVPRPSLFVARYVEEASDSVDNMWQGVFPMCGRDGAEIESLIAGRSFPRGR
jgi:tRNA dimethylallyltransferase